jgi:aromatic-L-amino-acid decarboxylase
MTPEQFRHAGRRTIDWIAQYLETIERHPVASRVAPGDIRRRLPQHPPQQGEPFDAVLQDLDEVILPGITHWQSPNFFAYFPANASPPAILGDLVSSGLGVQGMLWATSPACTELETHVLDWLVELLGLPDRFHSRGAGGGVIQDSASSASLCALLAARERATEFQTNEQGVDRPLTAYASIQAHSSIEKAAGIAGIGRRNLRLIEVDAAQAMRPELLERAIEGDRKAGRTPFFVCATVGTTSSTAIDPVPAVAEVCRRHGVWLHVDAAHAGSAALCPELRWIHAGVEHADSYCFNPHKWMLTNFDCDCFYVADRASLISTFSVTPEYLRNPATESGRVFDYRDWQVPLGRRFRALKLWFVLRHYGAEGLRAHIRQHVALAQEFAAWVAADDRFELAAPTPLNLVCFRHRGGDAANERLLNDLNDSGKVYLTHTRLDGRLVLRLAIGGVATERRHVAAAWKLIRDRAAGAAA